MSSGAIGTLGSVATASVLARNAEADRANAEAANHNRRAASGELAEKAAGIGQTEKESETSDRDADGRRFWEFNPSPTEDQPENGSHEPVTSRDPSGTAGTQLDLTG